MAAPYYQRDQQAYPMQEQVVPAEAIPPQPVYPARAYLPPQNYTAQGPPPTYQSEYNYQQQPIAPNTANNTIVVVAQPPAADNTAKSQANGKRPKEPQGGGGGVAIAAIVVAAFALFCCSCGVLVPFFIPSLCLAVCATCSKGKTRTCCASISIGLNVLFIVIEVLFIVVFLPAFFITADKCVPFYSVTYDTLCVPVLPVAYTCSYRPGVCIGTTCRCS